MQRRSFIRGLVRTAAGLYIAPTIIEPVRRFWAGADFGVRLGPTQLGEATAFSRQLLMASMLDVEELIRADLASMHALSLDRELFP